MPRRLPKRWRPRSQHAPIRLPTPIRELFTTDPPAVLAVATLIVLGELNLLAMGADDLAVHQLLAVVIGAGLVMFGQRMRAESLRWLGWAAYGVAVALLLAVDLLGTRAYGAQRWIAVGSVELQPSELAKLGLLLVLAVVLGVRRPSRGRVAGALALAAVPIVLTVLQPDLSTTALLTVVVLSALLLARVPYRVIGGMALAAAVAAPIALRFLHSYQVQRLHAFLAHGADPQGAGYSTLQAHIAIASGGFFGTVHAPIHQLLASYLPARHTDLAFASLVEQWGFVAGAAALLAVVILVWRLVAAATQARAPVPGLVAGALAVLFSTEVAVSVAGNLGLTPLAGVPFPFVSYGGTAAAVHLAALGIVLGARRQARRQFLPRAVTARLSPRLVRLTGMAMAGLVASLGALTYHDQQALGATFAGYGVAQMTRCTILPASRGVIEDRHGAPLAVNDPSGRVYVVPALLLQQPAALSRLAELMGRPPDALARQVVEKASLPGLDLGAVTADAAAKVDAAHLPAVTVIPSQVRRYPTGRLLGPVLGFTGMITAEDLPAYRGYPPGAIIGRSGMEREYDALLRGRDGRLCVYVDPQNRPVAIADVVLPQPGNTLRLSIDLALQQEADAVIQRAFDANHQADLAAGVILDGKTGQVLAMVSLPSYDNNIYGPPLDLPALERAFQSPGNAMLEHATQVAAPPGSTFKLVVAAADTVYNAIPPAEVIPTGYWFNMGGGWSFHGWGYLPPQNLSQAIAWSNDVYFYKLGLALGPENMAGIASRVGAGVRTGIDLPGESAGLVGTPALMDALGQNWYPATTAFMGIGQGYTTATPIQVARWTLTVSSGRLYTPRLAMAERGPDDEGYVSLPGPSAAPLDFAPNLRPVQEGMRLAVTQGTATMLAPLPIPFGAKTGSAEDPSTRGGANAWFTCAGPYNDPEVVATLFFRGGGEGNVVAEPPTTEIMQWYSAHRDQVRASVAVQPPALDLRV
ncbi:MAG TPA: FtsW/RodA/SpoVE family cell cycle protein [Candidatus Dormibacteraeota bacterium]